MDNCSGKVAAQSVGQVKNSKLSVKVNNNNMVAQTRYGGFESQKCVIPAHGKLKNMEDKSLEISVFIYFGFNIAFNTLYRSYHEG